MDTEGREPLIPKHGGFEKLKTFQLAVLIFDLTVFFCDRYINKRSRSHDQMVQAARSGAQIIAEGSIASATSKKTEMKLTNVARASLVELQRDYADYLRQRKFPLWPDADPRRTELVAQRCKTLDDVGKWVREVFKRENIQPVQAVSSPKSKPPVYPEIIANSAHVLIGVTVVLLSRQLDALAKAFENEGGFTERLYRIRQNRRQNK